MKTKAINKADKNVRSAEELTELDVKDFRAAFCPYGYLDVQRAVSVAREAGISVEDLVEGIEQFADECDTKRSAIDPVAQAYDMIFQKVRSEVEEATGKDISNDVKAEIVIAGNFMCTSFDYTEAAKEEFLQIIAEIPEEDRSEALKFIVSEIA